MSEQADAAKSLPGGKRARWTWSEIAAWVVIVAAVGTFFVSQWAAKHRVAAAAQEEKKPGVMILLTARYAVGAKALLPTKDAGTTATMVRTVRSQAKSTGDQLRAAIVEGELEGKEAEAGELRRLEGQYPELRGDVDLLKRFYAGEIAGDSKRWKAFREREGWFADLAQCRDKPASDPERQAVMRAGYRTVGAMAGMLALVGVAGAAGLALLVTGIVLFVQGKVGRGLARDQRLPLDRRACVEGFAIYLAIMAGAGFVIHVVMAALAGGTMLGSWLGMGAMAGAVMAGLFWPKVRGQSWSEWRAATGLHGGKGFFREVMCGVGGYIAGVPVVAVGMMVTVVLTRIGGTDASHPIVREVTAGPERVALLVVLASVWAPITEELMFRGMLFAHLRQRFGFWISAVGVSLVFAIIHPQGWAGIPALACIALVLAGIREWRGSIVGCMTAHALNNTTVMVMLLVAVS